jgi:hypothetical protein
MDWHLTLKRTDSPTLQYLCKLRCLLFPTVRSPDRLENFGTPVNLARSAERLRRVGILSIT